MPQPLTVEVPHQFTKEEAKSRIQDGMSQVRAQLSAFVTSIEDRWTEDQMDFRLIAVGQTVTGRIEVFDNSVRIEVHLPWILSVLGERIRGRIRQQATLMLEKK
jgi:uncharacterized protein YpmS